MLLPITTTLLLALIACLAARAMPGPSLDHRKLHFPPPRQRGFALWEVCVCIVGAHALLVIGYVLTVLIFGIREPLH